MSDTSGAGPAVRCQNLTTMTMQQATDEAVVVRSPDGAVSVRLRYVRHGLVVERQRLNETQRARLVLTALFDAVPAFERWCDADPLRFEYPILSSQVRRQGLAILIGRSM